MNSNSSGRSVRYRALLGYAAALGVVLVTATVNQHGVDGLLLADQHDRRAGIGRDVPDHQQGPGPMLSFENRVDGEFGFEFASIGAEQAAGDMFQGDGPGKIGTRSRTPRAPGLLAGPSARPSRLPP